MCNGMNLPAEGQQRPTQQQENHLQQQQQQLQQQQQPEPQDPIQTVYACADPTKSYTGCILLKLKCTEGNVITITSAQYGFRNPRNVTSDCGKNDNGCRSDGECCLPFLGDTKANFSAQQRRSLDLHCSGHNNCTPQAPLFKDNLYSSVSYLCIRGLTSTSLTTPTRTTSVKTQTISKRTITTMSANNATTTLLFPNSSTTSTTTATTAPVVSIFSSWSTLDPYTTTTSYSETDTPSAADIKVAASEGFPVVAVVLPMIGLLLIGGAVGIYLWRKRRSTKQTSTAAKQDIGFHSDTADTLKSSKAGNEYDNSVSPKPLKTIDNYIVLEPENAYTYIDHEDAVATAPANSEKKGAKQAQSNPSYSVLEQENTHLPKGICDNNKFQRDFTTIDATQGTQSHNYVDLEPQSTHDTNYETQRANGTEPQNSQTINTDPQKSQTKTIDTSDPEKVLSDNYFMLEPHDTYSSIDPGDVVVQTLPENEYNVINMKGKPISRDPNYGTLKTVGQIDKDIEESGDYSHIRNNPNKNMDMNEFSHTSFRNVK